MDLMRISATEPSSMTLNQQSSFKKLKSYSNKVPKQAKTKTDGKITTQHYIFNQF